MGSVSFFVPGVPVPQGSKRHVSRDVLVESARMLGPWRSTVTLAARQAHRGPIVDGPVRVSCEFVFPWPKRWHRTNGEVKDDAPVRHATRPDADKLARAALDSLTGVVFRDDGQVCDLHATKRYGLEPGAFVMVLW